MQKGFLDGEFVKVLRLEGGVATLQFGNSGDVEHVPAVELSGGAFQPLRFVSAKGLAALVEAGVAGFHQAVEGLDEPPEIHFSEYNDRPWACGRPGPGLDGKGVYHTHFPHNLGTGQGRLSLTAAAGTGDIGRYGRYLLADEVERLVSFAARMGGWIAATAGLPAVRKTLERGLSPRGLNSDRNKIDLAALVAKFSSPGCLERKLWATRERAEAILSAYTEEVSPAWADLTVALISEARVGKAAVIAVALTLGWSGYDTRRRGHDYYDVGPRVKARGHGHSGAAYRAAREWLVQQHQQSG